MKSISRIKMDFVKARHDAGRIDNIAFAAKNLSKKLEDSMSELATMWTGSNSRKFLKKEEQLQKEIEQTARDLNEIAEDIRRIANTIYDAEVKACEIASGGGSR